MRTNLRIRQMRRILRIAECARNVTCMSLPIRTLAELGAAVRRHRLTAGLTQQQLADAAGVSRRRLGAFEKGERSGADLGAVMRVALALDLVLTLEPDPEAGAPSVLDDLDGSDW